ncbi:MAG TPA: hypothetical protein V6C81_10810 [Planktothrix sp.]|jgi:hypothetical protein
MTSPYEHADPAHAKHSDSRQVVLQEYVVQDEKSLSDLGRRLLAEQQHRKPTPHELNVWVHKTSALSGLKSKEQQDGIYRGEHLWIEMPQLASGSAVAKRESAAVKKVGAPVAASEIATAPRKTAGTVYIKEHRQLPNGPVCSAPEVAQIASWVTHNEVGKGSPTVFNPNDHGHGVSVGLMQWNQRKGMLPDLLKRFHESDPRKFDAIFGNNAKNALSDKWVREADFTSGPLRDELVASLPAFAAVQYKMREEQIQVGCNEAYEHNLTALRGTGVAADLVNHLGPHKTEKLIHRVPVNLTESARIDYLERLGEQFGVVRMTWIDANDKQLWSKK